MIVSYSRKPKHVFEISWILQQTLNNSSRSNKSKSCKSQYLSESVKSNVVCLFVLLLFFVVFVFFLFFGLFFFCFCFFFFGRGGGLFVYFFRITVLSHNDINSFLKNNNQFWCLCAFTTSLVKNPLNLTCEISTLFLKAHWILSELALMESYLLLDIGSPSKQKEARDNYESQCLVYDHHRIESFWAFFFFFCLFVLVFSLFLSFLVCFGFLSFARFLHIFFFSLSE